MALHLHRAERADLLVDALAAVLAWPLEDPMVAEVVSVPTRGVERWVAQRLSATLGAEPGRGDGVCANVDFPFPARVIAAALTQRDAAGEGDDWHPDRMIWPLLEVVEECVAEPWLATLSSYVGAGATPTTAGRDRRFGAVRHVADLFDHYGVHRPAMLRAWAAGSDVDGHGSALPADCVWQANLWRRLRDKLGGRSPAERLGEACARVRDDPSLVELPPRLSLFGLTRIPASYVEVFRALAWGRDVHLFTLHPSPVLWAEVARRGVPADPVPRDLDASAVAPRNPLLRSWARDAREMQSVLTGSAGEQPNIEHHHPVDSPTHSLLESIQADVRADRIPPGAPSSDDEDDRHVLEANDRSVQVHSCHGRARQVEVLRDVILHLLETDHTLEPRDVIIMCPDIDTFAPLIHATFGAGTDSPEDYRGSATSPSDLPPADLRVRLADRSLRQTNPVLAVVSELLSLAEARLTASQVLDFASRESVRNRFKFDDDDLARLEQWVASAGIRWGLDAAHRAPYALDGLNANTWRAGIARLLVGAAMSEDDLRLLGGVLPLDDVDSGDLDLAGRLAELIERLRHAMAALGLTQPVAEWIGAIAAAADSLTASVERDEWQMAELRTLLDDVAKDATTNGRTSQSDLTVSEIRTLLADRLRGRPTRANFRTGHLTVCTLVPMRSVPHRVVCLLGLDDGVFPRHAAADGDDILERTPCVGDRDPRSEDRQLLLDAVLAATDCLVVTYSGRDERTNAPLPPAVPLWELLDVVDATCRTDEHDSAGRPLRARDVVLTAHPLQPFDVRNYAAGALGRTGPWSFDHVNLGGARALRGPRAPAESFLPVPLPASDRGAVELDDLIRFVQHPVRAFLRQRLGMVLTDRATEPADALPIELGGLERWETGQRVLEARLAGVAIETCRAAELARGDLPPGRLGEAEIDGLLPLVEGLVARVAQHGPGLGPATSLDIAIDLDDTESVIGTVAGVIGDMARSVTFSRVGARHRLAAWARLLVLTAAQPSVAYTSVTIGRGAGRAVRVATAGPLPGGTDERHRTALDLLGALVELHRLGMAEPLPLFCETSAAFAQAVHDHRNPRAAARREWETRPGSWDREDRDPEHLLVLGGPVDLDEVVAAVPRPEEGGPGWANDEQSRLGRCARRLWDGLLAHEQVRES